MPSVLRAAFLLMVHLRQKKQPVRKQVVAEKLSHSVNFFSESGFFASCSIFMDNAFASCFINQTGSSSQSSFCVFLSAGFGQSNNFAGCVTESCFDRCVFSTAFCVGFYTADRRFNVRQRNSPPEITCTGIFYHGLALLASFL